MSYIDTFDHKFVGFFAQRQVYWPSTTVSRDFKDEEFGCNPDCVIIGGGSGEDPAVICSSPEVAVAQFIIAWQLALCDEKDTELNAAKIAVTKNKGVAEVWEEFIEKALETSTTTILHFPGWGVQDNADFYSACASLAMRAPYAPEKDGSFETWLLANIGELIVFGLPDLASDARRLLVGLEKTTAPLFGNFLTLPLGYPVPGGREIRDGKLVWGVRS